MTTNETINRLREKHERNLSEIRKGLPRETWVEFEINMLLSHIDALTAQLASVTAERDGMRKFAYTDQPGDAGYGFCNVCDASTTHTYGWICNRCGREVDHIDTPPADAPAATAASETTEYESSEGIIALLDEMAMRRTKSPAPDASATAAKLTKAQHRILVALNSGKDIRAYRYSNPQWRTFRYDGNALNLKSVEILERAGYVTIIRGGSDDILRITDAGKAALS